MLQVTRARPTAQEVIRTKLTAHEVTRTRPTVQGHQNTTDSPRGHQDQADASGGHQNMNLDGVRSPVAQVIRTNADGRCLFRCVAISLDRQLQEIRRNRDHLPESAMLC